MEDSDEKSKKKTVQQKLPANKKNNHYLQTLFAVLLTVFLLAAIVTFIIYINNQDIQPFPSDLIEYGFYPQSLVVDPVLLKKLNKEDLNWTFFDDCSTGNENYGSMRKTNAMKYADIRLDGKKYRAVWIEQYRSESALDPSLSKNSWQDDNGFQTNQIYWFSFDPISWKVVNADQRLLLSEKVLDAMPFNENFFWIDRNFDLLQNWKTEFSISKYIEIPCNLYLTSSIRKWLNIQFCNLAFSKTEKRSIKHVLHHADESENNKRYGLLSMTRDAIFLLSAEEVSEYSYRFSTNSCFAAPTDYAKCRGVWTLCEKGSETAWWWLRSPGDYSGDVISVSAGYDLFNADRGFFSAYLLGGVRAAMCLKSNISVTNEVK